MAGKKRKTLDQALTGTVKMSEGYVRKSSYEFYPDPEIVDIIQRGLAKNEVEHGYRYCP